MRATPLALCGLVFLLAASGARARDDDKHGTWRQDVAPGRFFRYGEKVHQVESVKKGIARTTEGAEIEVARLARKPMYWTPQPFPGHPIQFMVETDQKHRISSWVRISRVLGTLAHPRNMRRTLAWEIAGAGGSDLVQNNDFFRSHRFFLLDAERVANIIAQQRTEVKVAVDYGPLKAQTDPAEAALLRDILEALKTGRPPENAAFSADGSRFPTPNPACSRNLIKGAAPAG